MKSRTLAAALSIATGWTMTLGFAGQSNRDFNESARRYLELIRKGRFGDVAASTDINVYPELCATRLRATWSGAVYSFGPYVREIRVGASVIDAMTRVTVACEFQDMAVNVHFAFDPAGRLASFHVTPNGELAHYVTPAYVDRTKFREELVTVSAGKWRLPGTLTIPVGGGPFAGVVLVHGMGPTDQDETVFARKPFKDLAWGLASRGVTVLRYDKRSYVFPDAVPSSEFDINADTSEDAVCAVQLMHERNEIDPDRIFMFGHSLGAAAAPYIASRETRISGIILFGAPARPIYELLVHQMRYLAILDGVIDGNEQALLDQIEMMVEKLRTHSWKPGDMLTCHPVKYWAGLDQLAPVAYAKRMTKPILILQGGRDFQVPDEDFRIWKRELDDRSNVMFRRFDALDHAMAAGEGPSSLERYKEPGHVDQRLIQHVADWIHHR